MLEDAEKYASFDQEKRQNVDLKNQAETLCYEAEKELTGKIEITRFKGLGEISPEEFKEFIGPDIRLDPVICESDEKIQDLLRFYMGKNTPERQSFIIDNLKIENNIESVLENE